jgi:hypothetical protein
MLVIPAFRVRIWSAIMHVSLVCVINSFSLYLIIVLESVVPETVDSSVQYYIVITIDYPPIIFVGVL